MLPVVAGAVVLLVLLFGIRLFATADIKRLAFSARRMGGIVMGLLAAGLLVEGRIGFAIVFAGAAYALFMGRMPPWFPNAGGNANTSRPPQRTAMSRAEALNVLGLKEGASAGDIRAAHRRLILATHPDKGGTSYLAAKINEAKDVLLG